MMAGKQSKSNIYKAIQTLKLETAIAISGPKFPLKHRNS